jgi:hypothetical protein
MLDHPAEKKTRAIVAAALVYKEYVIFRALMDCSLTESLPYLSKNRAIELPGHGLRERHYIESLEGDVTVHVVKQASGYGPSSSAPSSQSCGFG